jgi:CBS domain-containing protein
MNYAAKDIMQTHVITVGVDDPLMSVYRLFTDEEISGAPVVNEQGELEGVITIRDLLRDRQVEEDSERDHGIFFQSDLAEEARAVRAGDHVFCEKLISRTAGDVMSRGVVSVDPDMPVSKIAEILIVNRIHRVLVHEGTEDGRSLLGIISLFDLVELLA